jgi:hypothetical protein
VEHELGEIVLWLDGVVDSLSGCADPVRGVGRGRRGYKYNMEPLLQMLFLSRTLRDASNMRAVIIRSIDSVLPKALAEQVKTNIVNSPLPSAPTISRMRLRGDLAFQLHMTELNEEFLSDFHYHGAPHT